MRLVVRFHYQALTPEFIYMTIREIEESIVEEFSAFTDWMDRYEYIIELGKGVPPIEESEKNEENLIRGCQSRVWLNCFYKEGKLYFSADSDAIITKGIIALLIRVYNGQAPKDILESDLSFIQKIGLQGNLSPARANGLVSMIKQIKAYALAYMNR